MSAEDFALDVGTNFCKIIWSSGAHQLGRSMREGPARVQKAALITAHRMAPQVEAYAKNNAPWHDRTGAARNGLAARAYDEGTNIGIVLYHQVSYGIWLEVANSGNYAIIQPTIDVMGPQVMSAYEDLLARI